MKVRRASSLVALVVVRDVFPVAAQDCPAKPITSPIPAAPADAGWRSVRVMKRARGGSDGIVRHRSGCSTG